MYQSGRAMTSEQLKERIKLLNVMGIALPVFFVAGAAAFFVYAFFAESMLLILLAGVLPCMVFAVFAVGLVRAAKPLPDPPIPDTEARNTENSNTGEPI